MNVASEADRPTSLYSTMTTIKAAMRACALIYARACAQVNTARSSAQPKRAPSVMNKFQDAPVRGPSGPKQGLVCTANWARSQVSSDREHRHQYSVPQSDTAASPSPGSRSKVRIRSVASPMGRRYIQFSDGSLQSRLTLRVAVCH